MSNAPHNRKEGSALITVLALSVVLTIMVADFGHLLRGDLQAEGSYYDAARCYQLARSAVVLAEIELTRKQVYSDDYGRIYFLTSSVDIDETVEELKPYRQGFPLGAGTTSYALIHKPSRLDPNELTHAQWHRLLEVACEMVEGDERSELVDCAMDWMDSDTIQRSLGAEADAYESMEPPRYIKNGELESMEELLRINGFTHALLYGERSIPLREEDGMLFGGGLYQYLVGDSSPEGRASRKYILTGIPSEETLEETLDDDELTYTKLQTMPPELYLVARGQIDEAEHLILAKLSFVEDQYRVIEWHDHADQATLQRLTTYGLEHTDIFLNEEPDYDS